MTNQEARFPIYYLRQVADQLEGGAVDASAWLARHGLRLDELTDTTITLPFATYLSLLEDAIRSSREPALGLLVGARLPINAHGVVGLAAMSSATLRQLIGMVGQFVALRSPLVSVSGHMHGDAMQVQIHAARPLAGVHRFVMETVALTIKNLVDFIAGARHIATVGFDFPAPDYAPLARDLFQCEVQYGQAVTSFTLPAAVLDLPLKLADPTTFGEAAAMCQREMERLHGPSSLPSRVRRILLQQAGQFPSLDTTARLLNCTPRTLHRRLGDEGTSFQQLLDEVRRSLAREHLRAGKLSLQEIAYMLGYTDMANFRRAFKRWEGVPPSSFSQSERRLSK